MKLYTGDNGFGFFPESSVFAYIWAKVQQDFQHEYLYTATSAGMFMDVEINPDDVEICWKGFSDCLPNFVETTTNNLVAMRSAKAREIEPMFNVQTTDY